MAGEPALPDEPIRRVLVICHGNVCRSPFAAALLEKRMSALQVRSRGLAATDGDEMDPTARRLGALWGLALGDHRTRLVNEQDIHWADLILGMQGRHAAEVARRWPQAADRMRLLGHFLPDFPFTIADPWGQPEAVFTSTFERIEVAVDRVASLLEARGS